MLVKSRVKYIQSLGQKKQRDIEGVFIAEGPKIVAELLSSAKLSIQQMYGVKEWLQPNSHLLNGIEAIEITEDELGKISQLTTPNQVLALVKQFDTPVITAKNNFTLVLDAIQDPGNLGTIIRIADWFGIDQIVCSMDCADLYNPKVVQSTMGSIARVKTIYTDLPGWLSQQTVQAYAAALDGKDITTFSKPKEGIIIIGNESKGISASVMEKAGEKITIVRKGQAESLNAAVATGIILSHMTSSSS